jgi:hypothetical protein
MKFLKIIIGIILNDWTDKYIVDAIWQCESGEQKKCFYHFQFSNYLNQWRLIAKGRNPYKHSMYMYLINNFEEYVKVISDPAQFKAYKQDCENIANNPYYSLKKEMGLKVK